MAAVTTAIKVTMTLPEWSDESAAREIDRGIAALPPQPSCGALGGAANALGDQVIRKYNERDRDYDRSTDHGRNQGAHLP